MFRYGQCAYWSMLDIDQDRPRIEQGPLIALHGCGGLNCLPDVLDLGSIRQYDRLHQVKAGQKIHQT